MLSEIRLRWLGHVKRMEPGRIPKDILHGEVTEGKRKAGHPFLRYKDTWKRDLKPSGIYLKHGRSRETTVQHGARPWGRAWKQENRRATAVQKRQKRKEGRNQPFQPSRHVCTKSNRDCRSQVGLFSHWLSCQQQWCCTIVSRRPTDAEGGGWTWSEIE